MLTTLEKQSNRLAKIIKEAEVQFKWLVIWLFSFLIRTRTSRTVGIFDPAILQRVLFLRHDKIGDMVVTLPTLHALKAHYPLLEIDVLASPGNAPIIRSDPSVSQIFLYDKKHILRTVAILRKLRSRNYDVFFDLLTGASTTSSLLAMFIGPHALKVGVLKENLGRYYDFVTNPSRRDNSHLSAVLLESLSAFGIRVENHLRESAIVLSPEEWSAGQAAIVSIRDERYSRLIGINISAGRVNRSWNETKYAEVVRGLTAAYPETQFLMYCAPNEFVRAEEIVRLSKTNISLIPRGLEIVQVIAMIKCLDGIISPDTSICHIAASMNIPLMALYSGHEPHFQRWRPYGERVWIVRSPDRDSIDGITVADYLLGCKRMFSELTATAAVK